ncbi:MAG TPA: hypothetical protein VET23_01970 [Chitinophagaceae bacterium]|nr:hypothetical protein [Chitinophagaceae bacterium]
MKPKLFVSRSLLLVFSAVTLSFVLISWTGKQSPGHFHRQSPVTDTTPKEKKILNLDDVLNELDAAQMKLNMEKVQKELSEAMKNIEKLNTEKIKEEMDKALQEVDVVKLKKEVEESVAKIDWERVKNEMNKAKEINLDKMKIIQKKMEEMGPKIKEEMEKAKVKIEKAKAEMQEYKEFVDGLEKDGLVNKKEDYIIKHKNGELTLNGEKVSDEVYSKYRSFLKKHKSFSIEKNDDNFNIHTDRNRE